MHTICLSKLGNSGVQHFKRCVNRSWNEEVMVVWRQPHQAVRNFAAAKFRNPKPILQLQNKLWNPPLAHECHFAAHASIFAAANHVAKSPPSYEWSCESSPSCGIISKLWNHLQVAKPKFKLAKWIIQHVNHLVKSTCVNSDICNRLR